MSNSYTDVVATTPFWVKLFVLATWAVFVGAFFLLDTRGAVPIEQIIYAIGFCGLGIATIWLIFSGRWKYFSMLASGFVVVLYLLKIALLLERRIASSEPGLLQAINSLAGSWGAVFNSNSENLGLGWAILAIYTDLLMGIVQLLVIVVLFLFRDPVPYPRRKSA